MAPALSCAGGRILAARSGDEAWRRAWERAEDEDRDEATDTARANWQTADNLAHLPHDPTLPAEVAVPVLDGQGEVVAALAANVDDPTDEQAVRDVASRLARAARAAGRTLGHA